jgi:diguanylate cyclase (GGDEF)-like protein
VTKPLAVAVMQMRIQRILELRDLRRDLELQLETRKRQAELAMLRSVQDKLTGLYNREYLRENFEALAKKGDGGAFFMIDMDNFKYVNDNYGHIAGDNVLRNFGQILKDVCGDTAVACRIGGDEFMIYAPGMTGRREAGEMASGIMEGLNSCENIREYLSHLSLSIGIAFYPENGRSLQMLYQDADKALYYVKNNGKDSYHFFKDEEPVGAQYDVSADLDNICRLIEAKMDSRAGALNVVYGEFQQLYNFLTRYVERKHQQVQAVLVTIEEGSRSDEDAAFMTKAMEDLEESVNSSLRSSDVATRYSDRQYLIILMDADLTNGRIVTERVIRQFRGYYTEDEVKVYFDLRTIGG